MLGTKGRVDMNTRRLKRMVLASVIACLSVGSIGWSAEDPLITLSVEQTEMSDVLKFIAAQSGTSVVMAPDVSASQLTLDLQEVPLSECLDVILKPHGYGYRRIGKTIVVDKLEGLKALTEVEPLQTKVFKLKYMNAKDVLSVIQGVLSDRGSVNLIEVTQEAGWEFAEAGAAEGEDAGKRGRVKSSKQDLAKSSKTVVVKDVPESISQVTEVLSEIDVEPTQVEIQSYFIEYTDEAIHDLGVEMAVGMDIAGSTFVRAGTDFLTSQLQDDAVTDLVSDGLFGTIDYLGSSSAFEIYLHAIEGKSGINLMSAPRVLAQENQEAAIMVGTRLPIISYKEKDQGGYTSVETKLEYYEKIGIQLNVVPQVCANGLISMIIHPVVSEKLGDERILRDGLPYGAAYPVIRSREAETRLLVKDGQTIALGGLMNESLKDGVKQIPLLGDLPYIGRLFRRNTTYNSKTELVIYMSAHIRSSDGIAKPVYDNEVKRSEADLSAFWENKYLVAQGKIDELTADESSVELEVEEAVVVPEVEVPAVEIDVVEEAVVVPAVEVSVDEQVVEPVEESVFEKDIEGIVQDLTGE